MFSIETARLILRDIVEADLKAFFALGHDPAVMQFQDFIYTADEAQAAVWLKGAELYNQQAPREVYSLAILRKQDQAWLGWIGMGPPGDRSAGDLDFGYALHSAYWGQGYMSEALAGLVDFSFQNLAVEKIFGECEQGNPGSARVMEKAGLRREAAYTEVDEVKGKTKAMLRYSITRMEWEDRISYNQHNST